MAILTGNVVRAALIGAYDGQQVVNVLHFKSKLDTAQFAGITTAISALIDALVLTKWSSALSFTNVRYTTLDVPPEVAEANITKVGVSGTDSLPGLAALVVSWRTTYAGRSFRGRSYFSGLLESMTLRGVVNQVDQDAIQTGISNWLVLYGLGGSNSDWMFGVWSRKRGEIKDGLGVITGYNEALGFNGVVTALVRQALGSQRGRRFGT